MRARQLVPFAPLRASIRQAILTAHVAAVGKSLNRLVGAGPDHGRPPLRDVERQGRGQGADPTGTGFRLERQRQCEAGAAVVDGGSHHQSGRRLSAVGPSSPSGGARPRVVVVGLGPAGAGTGARGRPREPWPGPAGPSCGPDGIRPSRPSAGQWPDGRRRARVLRPALRDGRDHRRGLRGHRGGAGGGGHRRGRRATPPDRTPGPTWPTPFPGRPTWPSGRWCCSGTTSG